MGRIPRVGRVSAGKLDDYGMILIDGMKLPSNCKKCVFNKCSLPDRDCEGVPQTCILTDIALFDRYQEKPKYPKDRPAFCPLHNVNGKKHAMVFVVTAGDYSDYHIERIFTDKESARIYALQNPDMRVEEYPLDVATDLKRKSYVLVSYEYSWGYSQLGLTLTDSPVEPCIEKSTYRNYFVMTVDLSNERLYKSIVRYGNKSGLLKKIVHDKFAEYLYEHDTSIEELIRNDKEEAEKRSKGYIMFTSSIRTLPQDNPVNISVKEQLDKRLADGEALPDITELTKMLNSMKGESDNAD